MALPIAAAGADQVLLEAAIPATINLSGAASTCDPGRAIVSYAWTVEDLPSGSAAVLSNPAIVNPTFGPIDTWGNYRLFLQVTDDVGDASENVRVLAPDSAFTHARVTSTVGALELLAKGERNHQDATRKVVTFARDTAVDLANQTIADHDTTATGANLTMLTDGSSATGLHVHAGADVAVATIATAGVVELDEAPLDALHPKAVTKDRGAFTAHVAGTLLSTGYAPGVVGVRVPPGAQSEGCAAWYCAEAVNVWALAAALADSGAAANPALTVRFYSMTSAQYRLNDWAGATVIDDLAMAGIVPFKPIVDYHPAVNADVAAGDWIVARVTVAAPLVADMGADLTLTVHWKREV